MTKQEEIREEIAGKIYRWYKLDKEDAFIVTDQILKYEDSQGVVIRVERELPISPFVEDSGDNNGFEVGRFYMLRAGCSFFEPLIKGE